MKFSLASMKRILSSKSKEDFDKGVFFNNWKFTSHPERSDCYVAQREDMKSRWDALISHELDDLVDQVGFYDVDYPFKGKEVA